MYGEDVDITPQHRYLKNSSEFKAVVESVEKQIHSPHVVPLIKDGKFNHDWRNRGIIYTLDCCFEKSYCPSLCPRWQTVRSVFLGKQNDYIDEIPGVCDSTYRAGTFTIDEMELSEKYLKRSITFDEWLKKAVEDEWNVLIESDMTRFSMNRSSVRKQTDYVRKALDFEPPGYNALKRDIWFQEYSDIVRRIMLTSLIENPDLDLKQQFNLTEGAKALVIKTINMLRKKNLDIRDWLKLSIIAGAVGINTKPNHSATSIIIREASIPLLDESHIDKGVDQNAELLSSRLLKALYNPPGVDDTELFFQKIVELRSLSNIVRLVSFPDDYIETIFLLEFYDQLLEHFHSVHICMIPRSLHCGNDATASDVFGLLEGFPKLKEKSQGEDVRFALIENGPKIGGVNLLKLHPEAVDAIRKGNLLDVRGARNYEMMQRVMKDAFFGFMVARTTSEVLTGLDSCKSPFFYKFQAKGTCSFRT
jgi:hypothetical protein